MIPITAYALVNALGTTTSTALDRLFSGEARFAPPRAFDVPFETVVAEMYELPEVPEVPRSYDSRLLRIAMIGAREIAPSVRRARSRYGASRIALVLGSSTGGMAETERAYPALRNGSTAPGYDHDFQHPLSAAADALMAWFELEGPRLVVSTACSSSAKALASARRLLRQGLADAVVVAGVDSLCRLTLFGFHALGVLSPEPTCPFSRQRRGISLGEGAAFALLEAAGEARVHLAGIGESSDAHHLSSPDPEGVGVLQAMTAALTDARFEPARVGHVNAHGTGTLQNDAVESRALQQLFGRDIPVTSTKSMTGHLLGACGLTEAVIALASLERGEIPHTLGYDADPELGVTIVSRRGQPPGRSVLSNSFGFGGSNVSVLLVAPV